MRVLRPFAVLAIVSAALPVLDAQAAAPPEVSIVDAKDLTRERFAALPDTTVVKTRSGRSTAGALRARQKANATALAGRIESMKKSALARRDTSVARFQTEQQTRLDTSNARLRADASKLVVAPLVIGPTQPPTYSGPPEIQSAPATLEPGSFLPLTGRGFGPQIGKVVMKGLPTGDRVLTIEDWKSNALGVTVPKDIVGVKDQSVRLQVVRKDGTLGAERTIAFKATRELFYILGATVVKCGDDATDNKCDPTSGFFAVHTEDTFWEIDALGCDEWKIPPLLNGWSIQEFEVTEMSNGGGRVGGMSRPPVGATSHTWKACWSVPGTGGFSGNGAGYWGFYTIAGPKGVPYK